jgi:hypothetical protein
MSLTCDYENTAFDCVELTFQANSIPKKNYPKKIEKKFMMLKKAIFAV